MQRSNNFASTSMQRHDVSTLMQRCVDVIICPLCADFSFCVPAKAMDLNPNPYLQSGISFVFQRLKSESAILVLGITMVFYLVKCKFSNVDS